MPPLPLRIAILECDTLSGGMKANYGNYTGLYSALLRAGADCLARPCLSSTSGLALYGFDVVGQQVYPSLADIDAVLLSGSRHNAFTDDEWIVKLVQFTRRVLEEQDRVRVVGVCFGHQIIGRALGAKIGRSPGGWEVSVTAVDLTKPGQELFGRPRLVC
jgi:GMP synthase-like glutamine amidotransferase